MDDQVKTLGIVTGVGAVAVLGAASALRRRDSRPQMVTAYEAPALR
jgi:hypothetical protein